MRITSNPQIRPTTAKGAKNNASAASPNFAQNAKNIAERLAKAPAKAPATQEAPATVAVAAARVPTLEQPSKPSETTIHQPGYFAGCVAGGYISKEDIMACKSYFG